MFWLEFQQPVKLGKTSNFPLHRCNTQFIKAVRVVLKEHCQPVSISQFIWPIDRSVNQECKDFLPRIQSTFAF